MLYESLKQSIVEYKEKKKVNQKLEEKLIFRWKLITLGLSILLIVFIGVLSQFYKGISELTLHESDTTFLPLLLQKTNNINDVTQINRLMKGISLSHLPKFNQIQVIYSQTAINTSKVIKSIRSQEHLVFIFSTANGDFGIYTYKGYQGIEQRVLEDSQLRHSSIFGLTHPPSWAYTLGGDKCSSFQSNSPSQLLLLESIFLNELTDQLSIKADSENALCFSTFNNLDGARVQLGSLTIGEALVQSYTPLKVNSLQIYKLYLED